MFNQQSTTEFLENVKDTTQPVNTSKALTVSAKKKNTPSKDFETATLTQKHKRGWYIDSEGDRVYTNAAQEDVSDLVMTFLNAIMLYIQDPELAAMINQSERETAAANMQEEYFRSGRLPGSGSVSLFSSAHPDRDKTLPEIRKEHGVEADQLDRAIDKLMGIIIKYESGGDYNVVNDYRSRLPGFAGQGPFNGLNPGDTTLGGLVVPDVTTMKVSDVIAWQKKYIQEQKNYVDADFPEGIPVNGETERENAVSARAANIQRSSAIGGLQFTYTALERQVNEELLDPNAIFNKETQHKAAENQIIHVRGYGDFINGKTTLGDFMNGLAREWEGLKKDTAQQELAATLAPLAPNTGP